MGDGPTWGALLAIFATAFAAAVVGVPLAAAVGLAVGGGLVDQPRPGELQRRAIGRTGGYGLIAAFFLAVGVSLVLVDRVTDSGDVAKGLEEYRRLAGLALGAALIVPLAAWDDARRLPPLPQLLGQLACAALPLAFGVRLTTIANPFGGQFNIGAQAPLLVAPLTILWIIGMINALNMLDTMDGLAGGVSLISAVVLFAASLILGQKTIAILPLALVGACLGFLVFNFPPARIFMGTSGSMFLGYALGVLSIIGGAKIATAVLVLGLPIIDTALVIVRRLASGRSPMRGGDGAHLVHRLLKSGLSVRQIVLLVYALTAFFGSLSVALVRERRFYAFAAVALVIGAILLFVRQRGPAHD